MAELVVLNGSNSIARAVVGSLLQKSAGRYASVKLIDAKPHRQSVYQWQRGLSGVSLSKLQATNARTLAMGIEGATDVVYFTHDYYTMASDKNSHLNTAARLTKNAGVKNFVAVCPMEHDLAWSEDDDKSFHLKAEEAQASALSTNSNMTLLKTNLTFGPSTHLIHFLTQCAILGKCPYAGLMSANLFKYAPVHTDDLSSAVGVALKGGSPGIFSYSGKEQLGLRQIMDTLEKSAGKQPGSTSSNPVSFIEDYMWDFFTGNTADLNMARLAEFYEANTSLSNEQSPFTGASAEIKFSEYYESQKLVEEDYAHPTLPAYKCAHLD